jgi:hypothetical protein
MKKSLLLIGACLLFSKVGMSQDTKNVRFGIRTTPTINMMNPGTNKKVNKNGAVMKAGIGLVLEFKLSDVASFQTGVEYTGAGLKAKYDKDTAMYRYKDDAVVESDGLTDTSLFVFNKTGGGSTYQVTSRKYNIGYLNIPLTFKLRTKEISGMTYFGQIGGNVFIKTSAKADDELKKLTYPTTGAPTGISYASAEPIEKINVSNQVNLLTACGSIGAGAEYNISGSTALYASIHYQHHFMNATKADSDYLIRQKREGTNYTYSQFPNAMKLRQIVLAIGILF